MKIDIYSIMIITLSIMFVLIAFYLWLKYGKDDKVVETIEFYPPKGFNSAEIGYMYKGYVDDSTIISLLIYLANKGYLKIEQTKKQDSFNNKGFRFVKLKEYDGDNENERMFFDGLFENGRFLATEKLLYNRFYRTLDEIKNNIDTKENENKIFDLKASKFRKLFKIMIILVFIIITTIIIKPIIEYSGGQNLFELFFTLFFQGIGMYLWLTSEMEKVPRFLKIFRFISGLLFVGIPMFKIVLPALYNNPMYLKSYIIGIICIIVLLLFTNIMPKRTKYGNEMLGKIRGFKRFLETAEKNQLEELVERNPEYFYNMLPYTYALDVSKIWMEQFETIAFKEPDWYEANENFSTFMTTTMTSVEYVMSFSPSSIDDFRESSSSDSGGGSSGGGSGGGGGGSW
ncbi:MAG: hypothetical protein BHV99_02305 [Clostridium sp. 26_21]|nr:MAG: hypothetical protein BHV99_02305 [Clostridium sp. 26_21]